jgi:hypothetical protein
LYAPETFFPLVVSASGAAPKGTVAVRVDPATFRAAMNATLNVFREEVRHLAETAGLPVGRRIRDVAQPPEIRK